jgi:hypothetical protein
VFSRRFNGKTWKSIITADVDGFVRNIQEDYINEDS